MALIKCPECGKDISNKATVCIHCGFPIEDLSPNDNCIINGISHDLSNIRNRLLCANFDNKEEINQIIYDLGSQVGSISLQAAADLAKIILNSGEIPPMYDGSHLTRKSKEDDGKIHCPRCNSTNVVTGQRGYSMMWGFVGSNRTMNRCAKCGHKWEPRR